MIRKIALCLTASISAALGAAATEYRDTTVTEIGRAVITELPDGTTVLEITDKTGSVATRTLGSDASATRKSFSTNITEYTTYRIGLNRGSKWTLNCGGFNIGWTAAQGHPATIPVEQGKSWEIGWMEIVGIGYDASPTTRIKLGLGLDWRNYKITTPDYRFVKTEEGTISTAPYPESTTPRNSRLKVFSLNMPLMVRQQMPFRLFGQQQWIAVGAILDYSPHASLLTRWRDSSGKSTKVSDNKIGHRRWSYEWAAIVGLSDDIGIYMRYQPKSVLSGHGQPDFKSLSTGLIFFY